MKANKIIITLIILFLVSATTYYFINKEKEEKLLELLPKKHIRLAISEKNPPYSYRLNSKVEGIEIDIVRRAAEEIGRELIIIVSPFSNLMTMLSRKKVDIAAGCLAILPERTLIADFSEPYEFSGLKVAYRKGERIEFKAFEDEVIEYRLGGVRGATSVGLAKWFADRNRIKIPVREFVDIRDGIQALLDNEIDAVLSEPMVARFMQKKYQGRIDVSQELINHEEFAFYIDKNDRSLLVAINKVVRELWESGEMFTLYEKHLQQSLEAERARENQD